MVGGKRAIMIAKEGDRSPLNRALTKCSQNQNSNSKEEWVGVKRKSRGKNGNTRLKVPEEGVEPKTA